MKKWIFASLIATTSAIAKPPEPELGKRWVINNAYSDEFNGNSLDKKKWRDKHNSWKGRAPAMFDPSTVSVNNGSMQIKNKLLDKPKGKFTIGGGAVQSIDNSAYHGYYESRFKASRLNMSTTFWLSGGERVAVQGKNHLGQSCDDDSYGMELDIVEAVGGVIDKPFGVKFRTAMQYNTHVWYRGCDKTQKRAMRFSKGANAAEGDGTNSFSNKLSDDKEVWQDFNTYAAWWKNENNVTFYLNNNFAGHIEIDTSVAEKPYSQPLQMQMVTETYDWARPLPTPSELANDQINTSYYDWVRSYYYVDVNMEEDQLLERIGKADDIFKESATIKKTKLIRNRLEFSYLYETDENLVAQLIIKKNKKVIFSKKVNLKAGYGHVADQISLAKTMDFDKTQFQVNLILANNEVVSSVPVNLKVNVK